MATSRTRSFHLQGKLLHEMVMLYLRNHRELLAGTPEESVNNYMEIYMRMARTSVDFKSETPSCK